MLEKGDAFFMKRAALPLILLLAGFALGLLCSVSLWISPASSSPSQPQAEDSQTPPSLTTTGLLQTACRITDALQAQDYETLASYVHPDRGVTFTPYSTVDFQQDQRFSADQIKNLAQDTTTYTWGYEDGRGEPIQMTIPQYLERFVFDADYTQAPQVGVDQIITSGNALENLTEAYPGCRFVDFCYLSRDPASEGLDWCSLKLVFAGKDGVWYLVGVVHGEWTI